MDDQQTYLLNGLLTRHFGLGRIVRFRQVPRGRQATTFEIFTAQEREYLVLIYPPTYHPDDLEAMAAAVNAIDEQRFSVVPFVKGKAADFVAEGPQGARLMVSLAPQGSMLTSGQYSEHDISQIALRIAWMHRLLKDHRPDPPVQASLADRFAALPVTAESKEAHAHLLGLLNLPTQQGWAHGDLHPAALLHDSDHQLRAITDWGLLHHGCPLEDLIDAFLFLSFTGGGEFDENRGRTLLESYDSLVPIQRMPWTPVVARWCAQRALDRAAQHRTGPDSFFDIYFSAPERLATALASCM